MTATADTIISGRNSATGASTSAHGHRLANKRRGNTAVSENQTVEINSHDTVARAIGNAKIAGRRQRAAAHPLDGNASATAMVPKISAARRALQSSGHLSIRTTARSRTNARAS